MVQEMKIKKELKPLQVIPCQSYKIIMQMISGENENLNNAFEKSELESNNFIR